MTSLTKLTRGLVAGLLIASAAPAMPAFAAQADIDLLQSYVGSWSGRGTTTTGKEKESVLCKLTVRKSNSLEKVNFSGRCSLAGGVLSMNGTLAHVGNSRYEAVMTSNTPFKGTASGRRRGQSVSFSLRGSDAESGDRYSLSSSIALSGGKINIGFDVTNLSTGEKTRARVPFTK